MQPTARKRLAAGLTTRKSRRYARLLLLGVVLPVWLVTGCSFNRAWKEAGTIPVAPNSIAGRWEGTWRSDVNQHHGKLRCILTPNNPTNYTARFRATYMTIFRAGYTIPFAVNQTNGLWNFSGEKDLGVMGRVYTYEGHASGTNFFSTYRSEKDRGVFEMRRPE